MSLDPVTAGIDLIHSVVDKVFPDAGDAAKIKNAIETQREDNDVKLLLAQIGANQEEAKNTNWLIAGWRPFVAWSCAVSVLYKLFLYPTLAGFIVQLKDIDGVTFSLAFGLLTTLIGARTIEKYNGVDTK
jgi:hypothetical protein